MFNHSQSPNVTFTLDSATESIRYTTTRDIRADEELCIFYGHKLWFNDMGAVLQADNLSDEVEDGWGGLSRLEGLAVNTDQKTHINEDQNAIVPEEDLPFARVRITPDEEEEEDMDSIHKSAYIVTFNFRSSPSYLQSTCGRLTSTSPQKLL